MKFIDFLQELEDSAEEWNWQDMNALDSASSTSLRLQVTHPCIYSRKSRESSWTKCH